MAAGLRAGIDDKLYRNTGSWNSPVWVLISGAIDVDLGLEYKMADVKARLSRVVQHLPTVVEGPITFKLLADTSLPEWLVLRNAFMARTLIGYAVADDFIATAGTEHWRGDYYVAKFPPKQPLEEANTVDVELSLGYSANVPLWTTVV